MRFEKWQALGNDYLIVEADELPWELSAARVRRLCDPHFGVGSDGVLLLSRSEDPGLVAELRIFNPDGSEAELSGNGAREAVLYLRRHGWTGEDVFTIGTAGRTDHADDHLRADLLGARWAGPRRSRGTSPPGGRTGAARSAPPTASGSSSTSRSATRSARSRSARSWRSSTWRAIGPGIEAHELFPNRTNVSFLKLEGSRVRARIFERGVGETLSSGTGASGAAVAAFLRGAASPIVVELDGGELEVEVSGDLDVRLTGWAEPIYAGELSPELLEALADARRLDSAPVGIAEPSKRLEAMPPYMFQELERQIADKRAAGIDVISLGIGDPDEPTYPYIVEAMQEAVADPSTHQYPTNRGRDEFREAFADFYERRFGVEIDPESEVIPAIGAKECIYNLCFAFLDPGGVALASDPGYPVYTGGPILAEATPELLPLVPELGFAPDLGAVPPEVAAKARLMFLNYPNNPTGAVVPEGFFELVVSFAREHEILVVHDNAYSETTYDGYVAPSFLATPGAKEVGVEVFSLSKGYNMTGWRCAAILGNAEAVQTYWRLKTNVDSGLFEAVQLAGAAALRRPERAAGADERDLRPPPRPGGRRAARDRRRGQRAEGDDLRLGAGPRGPHLDLVRRAGARAGGGRRLARLDVRAERRGLLPHRADHARRPHRRGGRADARAPRLGRFRAVLRRSARLRQ